MSDPPEKSKFDKKSGHRNSPELSPSEGDFWDLESEQETAPLPPAPRAGGSAKAERPHTPAASPGPIPTKNPARPKEAPGPEAILSDKPKTSEKPKRKEEKDGPPPQGFREVAASFCGRVSKTEKIALLSVGACLLVGVIWALSLFFNNIHTDSPDIVIDYPVAGKFATLAKATTYWKTPNHETDRVRPEARLVPAAKLTLDPAVKSGALRILFEDDSGNIVGDPITLTISNGNFSNASKEIEIFATDGFNDEGDHAAYLTEQIGKWFVLVKEGPDRNARGNDFTDLVRIPISNSRY